MKFVFDYEETLARRITIDADCLSDAIKEVERRIEDEEIVLCAEDFASGQISMPLEENYLPQLRHCGDSVEDKYDLDILVDYWQNKTTKEKGTKMFESFKYSYHIECQKTSVTCRWNKKTYFDTFCNGEDVEKSINDILKQMKETWHPYDDDVLFFRITRFLESEHFTWTEKVIFEWKNSKYYQSYLRVTPARH